MNMKNAILATGAALLIAVLLSSPTFAQTSTQQPANAAPAPAPAAIGAPAADTPIDELIDGDITLDRAELIRRCAGPPPRPFPTTRAEQEQASEAATIAAH
jgi:hypothetical protein